MITGFNTDVVHDGVTYHVQTEDKGLQTPLILTLVYDRGAILAARRTPYDDLIAEGFQEAKLAERLGRQHALICAAIKAGRLKDLQRKYEPHPEPIVKAAASEVAETAPQSAPQATTQNPTYPSELPVVNTDTVISPTANLVEAINPPLALPTNALLPTARVVKPGVADFARTANADKLPQLQFVDEQSLTAGEQIKLRIKLIDDSGNNRRFAGIPVKIKIIGTAFHPLQQQSNANGESVATFNLQIPAFNTGRAVLLVTASVGDYELELRRIIGQATQS